MKHELVEIIEASINNGIGVSIDLLERFNCGEYDFGQDKMGINDSVVAAEYKEGRDFTENRLNGGIVRSAALSEMIKNIELDSEGLYSEDDFSDLLSKVGGVGRRNR